MKDKHAVTKQYLTIPSRYELGTKPEKNMRLSFLGYIDRGLKLGDLEGNRFEITVRDLRKGEIDGPLQKSAGISGIGVPNYFDSQRFGSVINKEFIAKWLMKKDYEKAVRIFLTSTTKFESKASKDEKKRSLTAGGDSQNSLS